MRVRLKWLELLCGETGSAILSFGDVWDVTSCQLIWCWAWVMHLWSARVYRLRPLQPSLVMCLSPPMFTPISSLGLIWTIRARTGEASFMCAHPTSFLSIICCHLFHGDSLTLRCVAVHMRTTSLNLFKRGSVSLPNRWEKAWNFPPCTCCCCWTLSYPIAGLCYHQHLSWDGSLAKFGTRLLESLRFHVIPFSNR